ncbi:NLI interacting factor-like phosphatase (macronuclear) [Tetrahymena thermophila SB210]|uniref:NLI interacting factor-like phosphatase n=1 Tax=Tetrahymena thermophila (strain SB210) TaxID=312017 RepID=I7MB88_TETTS|nr:NLI interacting factor-like phosphatase [Tetrahymena thermophila SB210]EAS07878.1 NLI interacting factor-like phosphatase [Tetrahymena thermophila SB210]|eukprot:XP_001028120.1 NLI interacting factor-like phosphatase [Tetrahymena thermophila SB210]
MAQLLVLKSERKEIKFEEQDEMTNSKSQGICDEDCHIGDKIKYFECYNSGYLRSPSKKYDQNHQKQKRNQQENEQTLHEDAKSKESEKESFDSIPSPEIIRQQSLSLPLRQNKQRLNSMKGLTGDVENNIDEQQEPKNIEKVQYEETSEENKGSQILKEQIKNEDIQGYQESEDEANFQLDKQKKIQSAPPIQIVKSKSPSSLTNIQNFNQESPVIRNSKVEFYSDCKPKQKQEPVQNTKSAMKEITNYQMQQSSKEDIFVEQEIKRQPSRKFSVRQKQVSEEFIKFNVECQQLENLDQKELKMINQMNGDDLQCEMPDSLFVSKKISAIDEMIPQEPDKSSNMEKLQTQMSKTQCKKNIDDKLQKNVVCQYYVKPLLRAVNLALRDNISCLFREHFLSSFQSFHMMNTIPVSSQKEIDERCIIMPPFEIKKKKTLILDLDETLIHCNESLDNSSDFILDIQADSKEVVQAGINVRPFAKQFLEEMSHLYEIVIFTASRSVYANEVINKLDPQNKFIFKRLFRENCIYKNRIYIKDLRIFKNRDIKNLVIVDNCCLSFCHNILNGIPIVPFYDDKRDQELLELSHYLRYLAQVDDVRPVIKNSFKFKQYKNYQSPSELIREIY